MADDGGDTVMMMMMVVVGRHCNPGIPANFANPQIPGMNTRNPGIFGIEKFPISVHYYVTK